LQRTEPTDIVSRLFATVDERNWSELGRLFVPWATYARPGYPLLVGIEEITRFYRDVRIVAQGCHIVQHRLLSAEQGFSRGLFHGVSRAGDPLSAEFAEWYEFADDRILHRRTYFYQPGI
jgi:ketosteroid isomerase-like protein